MSQSDYYNQEHIPEHSRAGLTAMNAGRPLAALEGDTSSIIDRLELGESAPAIAKSLGIHHTALYAWLIKYSPDRWQQIQAARQLARLDDCEAMIDGAITGDYRTDGLTVTRARESARMAQWHLERANRKLFGDSKQIINENKGLNGITIILPPGSALADQLQQGQIIEHDMPVDNPD